MDANVVVVVPGLEVAEVDLHHADAAFDESQRHQTAATEVGNIVAAADVFGLLANVEKAGGFGLQAEGRLHGLDRAFKLGLAADAFHVTPVKLADEAELLALLVNGEMRIAQMADELFRLDGFVVNMHALEAGGHVAGAPERRTENGETGAEDDEAGEVSVVRAEAIREPGSHGWAARKLVAAVHQLQRRAVVAVIRMHGADEAEVVDSLSDLRENLADLEARLAVALELPRTAHKGAAGAVRPDFGAGHGLAIVLGEGGLVVESVDLRHATVQKKKDDVFGLGREVRLAVWLRLQHALEGAEAEAAAECFEKFASWKHVSSRLRIRWSRGGLAGIWAKHWGRPLLCILCRV